MYDSAIILPSNFVVTCINNSKLSNLHAALEQTNQLTLQWKKYLNYKAYSLF